jgi:hypothetical protein
MLLATCVRLSYNSTNILNLRGRVATFLLAIRGATFRPAAAEGIINNNDPRAVNFNYLLCPLELDYRHWHLPLLMGRLGRPGPTRRQAGLILP